MASSGAEIIKEYLVSLGFKIDQASLNKFDGALVKTAKAAFSFAGVMVGLGTATVVAVDKIAQPLERLYWSSVRLRDSVSHIQDFRLAISKLGGSADGALQALEGMSRYLRTNPAAEGFLRNLGVQTRDAEGHLRNTIDIVKDFAQLPLPYWLKVRFAERFGIDEQTLQAIVRDAGHVDDALTKLYKDAGLNADEAAKSSAEFENSMRDLHATTGVLAARLERDLLPIANALLTVVETLTVWILKLDGATNGWGSSLLILAVVVGGLALAFGWIPALIGLLAIAALEVIANWDKVKAYFNNFVGWIRDKYNTVAKYLGLPQWSAPKEQPGGTATPGKNVLPDYKTQERDLGANSLYGAGGVSGKALAFFQKAGWTSAQAAGIVSNLLHESGLKPGAVGDNGQAFGIGQWHADRQAAFKAWAGKDIRNSTLEEQLAFVNHELRNGAEKVAGKLLSSATNAAQAGALVSKYYERPAGGDATANLRGRTADSLVNGARLAPGRGGGSHVTVNAKTDINVHGSGDADSTARATAREQNRVNGDLVRNFAGAMT